MDRNKIEYLKEKQRLLQKEIRLKQLRKRIAPKLNYLEEHSFAFKVFYDFKYINWINDNIKVRPKMVTEVVTVTFKLMLMLMF